MRKGNEIAKHFAGNNVDVILYAVEKSLDSYKFNLLHCKQTFISQLKSGAMGARTIDEGSMDEKSGMNFSEYMAILSGNTDLLDKAKLDKRIAALEGERKSFNRDRAISARKLDEAVRTRDGNNERISRMGGDYERFTTTAQRDSEGNILNLIKLDGVQSSDIKRIGSALQEIAKRTNTKGEYKPIGELYGFKLLVKSEQTDILDSTKFANRFFVEGEYKYSFNNGQIAMADTKAAAMNFLRALESIPQLIERYQKGNEQYERDIPTLQEIVSSVWRKEDELKQLKSESAALERQIQLSLTPPKDEKPEQGEEQSTTTPKVSQGDESRHRHQEPTDDTTSATSITVRQVASASDNTHLVRPTYTEPKQVSEPKPSRGFKL